jgi:hypothetical protein
MTNSPRSPRPLPLGHGLLGDPWTKQALPPAVEWTDEVTGPSKYVPSAPTLAPTQPVRLSWSDPTRAAARVAARTKRAERLAMYLAQGLTSVAAEERANRDVYQEVTRGTQS